jgi:hypothetical protein
MTTWTISKHPLIGSVYYWANSLGRVLRINPGATGAGGLPGGGRTERLQHLSFGVGERQAR